MMVGGRQQKQQHGAGWAPPGAAAFASCRRCWLTIVLAICVVFLAAERWLSKNLWIVVQAPPSLVAEYQYQASPTAQVELTATTTTAAQATKKTRMMRPPAPAPGPGSSNAQSGDASAEARVQVASHHHSNVAAVAKTVSLVCSLPHPLCSDWLNDVASRRQRWVTAEEKVRFYLLDAPRTS